MSRGLEWLARWGRDHPPERGLVLDGGPWQARLVGGELVDLRVAQRQLLRRLCVRVRGADWNTIEGVASKPGSSDGAAGLKVAFTCRHRDSLTEVDFEWSGELCSSASGVLEWSMLGRAHRAFDYNRIGICLLLNPEVFVGQRYSARCGHHTTFGRIDALISPQPVRDGVISPMFDAFTELELELDGGGSMRCSFAGDVFEMEDQRNWSDGSLKIYSSPVGDPVPRHADAGEQITQRVRIAFSGDDVASAAGASTRRSSGRNSAVRLMLGDSSGAVVPPIGLGLDSDGHEPSPGEQMWLSKLAPAHLRVDVSAAGTDGARESLGQADRVARALRAELEVAISMPPGSDLSAPLSEALAELDTPIARLMILDGARVTGAADAERARRILPGVPVVCGTDAYFAECNRARPDLEGVDGLVYPLTPQVHDCDEQALIESLGAQGDTVRTARAFAGKRPIHVSPITLRPRWNPLASSLSYAGSANLPPRVDHRQPTTFAAAWTCGAIHRLAFGGAASVTFYELTGSRGVMQRDTDATPAQRPGGPFPLFWILAEAARLRDRACLPAVASDPLSVEALAIRDFDGLLLLLASLRPNPVRVVVEGLAPGSVEARPLDALAGGWGEPETRDVRGGACALELAPWSVTRAFASCSERAFSY